MPIAVLAPVAVAYPRLRAGARAILALSSGLVAAVGGGAEAGYTTLKVGPSGDDHSGLLMLVAGAGLMVLAVVTLFDRALRGAES